MSLVAQREHWNQGIDAVPWRTGAASVMDCSDIRAVCHELGIELPFAGLVLDVGCGTGRLSQLCEGEYVGVDIAPDVVKYCQRAGLRSALISGPDMLGTAFWGDTVACLSVFTHISRDERRAYLKAFQDTDADCVLVDVIPGDGSGNIALWTADWDEFLQDLSDTGWEIASGPVDRRSWDGPTHRYIWARPS